MFMEPEITEKQKWVLVDGTSGSYYVPEDSWEGTTIDLEELGVVGLTYSILPTNQEEFIGGEYGHYKSGDYTVEIIEGYGVRFSAPGYLDCTEWQVYSTYKDAYGYFIEDAKNRMDEDEAKELRSYMRNNFLSPTQYRKTKGKK